MFVKYLALPVSTAFALSLPYNYVRYNYKVIRGLVKARAGILGLFKVHVPSEVQLSSISQPPLSVLSDNVKSK